jgi:hypothetical protein
MKPATINLQNVIILRIGEKELLLQALDELGKKTIPNPSKNKKKKKKKKAAGGSQEKTADADSVTDKSEL